MKMLIQNREPGEKNRRGFTLVELAIVLGVASILFAGLWRLMAAGNTQLRDQTAADQHRQLIESTTKFLASSDGQAVLTAMAANATANLAIPAAAATCPATAFVCHLPPGFSNATQNSYGQTYVIRLRKDGTAAGSAPQSYSFMIATSGGDTVPDVSGGRIATLIGGDGGFRYSEAVCGAVANACGAYNAWSFDPNATYGSAVAAGHIVSRTFISSGAQATTPWLARVALPGDDTDGNGITEPNTIQTNIDLGGRTLQGSSGIITGLSNLSVTIPLMKSNAVVFTRTGCGIGQTYDADVTFPAISDCDYTIRVNGGMSVSGLSAANRLYAIQFLYNVSSDRALKSDIKPIGGALEKVASLRGYSFKLRNEEKTKYGVIAQDVAKVFPEAVTDMGGDMKGVDYMGLIGPLVAAVHDLKKENDELKRDIATLKEEVENLKETPAGE